jgi:osmotically inducible lipoprotein OsmB
MMTAQPSQIPTKYFTLAAVIVMLAGCSGLSAREQRALTGGAIGAGSGAAIGAIVGGSVLTGALVGGAGGAAIGALIR